MPKNSDRKSITPEQVVNKIQQLADQEAFCKITVDMTHGDIRRVTADLTLMHHSGDTIDITALDNVNSDK